VSETNLRTLSLTGSRYRVFWVIFSVTLMRVALAVLLYYRLAGDGADILFQKIVTLPKWMYLFAGWDSSYYYIIAESWYPQRLSPLWAFSPMFPTLVRLFAYLGSSVPLAGFCVAQVSCLISIILFQMTAEKYFSKMNSASATLLYFTFPPVFVFSAVSYSESVFLLFSLLAWYWHLAGREKIAGVAAAASSLARPYGFLIGLPLAYDYVRKRRYSELLYAALPLLIFLAWMLYSFQVTGDFAVISSLHTYWSNQPLITLQAAVVEFLRGNFQAAKESTGVLLGLMYAHFLRVIMGLVSIALVAFLGYKALAIDHALGAYVIGSLIVISVLGFFPSLGSFPRYLAFLFPIGLVVGTRRRWLLVFGIATFIFLNYFAWWAFISDGFY